MFKNFFKISCVFLGIATLIFCIFYFVGIPKTGHLNIIEKTRYPKSSITYKEAFNSYFNTPTWSEFVDKNGNPVVQFSGVDSKNNNIVLQWLITSNGAYKLYYFSKNSTNQNLNAFKNLNEKIYNFTKIKQATL